MRLSSVLVLMALIAPTVAAQQAPSPSTAPTLRGVVTTANDEPLARVRVAVTGVPASDAPVLTDDRGQFSVRVPDADPVRVTLTKARYATVTADVRREQLNATELRVRMSLGGVIAGQVRDRSDVPVMLASVTARRVSPAAAAAPVLNATTNDMGEFRFANLESGAYIIAARPPTLFSTATLKGPDAPPASQEQTVNVGLGAEIGGIDVTIDMPSELPRTAVPGKPVDPRATGSLRGRVLTPQGAPIAGAIVQAYLNGAPTEAVESDARGRYVIERLVPGDYTLWASRHGYLPSRQSQSSLESLLSGRDTTNRMFTVRSGQVTDSIDVTLARGGTISGTIVDEFGEPMQGVTVNAFELRVVNGRMRALRAVSASRGTPGRTDDRGRYRLFGLQQGTYLIQATPTGAVSGPSGYMPVFYPGTPAVDLATPTKLGLDAVAGGIDLQLQSGPVHRIRGTVLTPAGQPPDVTLMLTLSERSSVIQTEPVTARTNADGSFAFNNVPPGNYIVQAMAIGRTGPGARTALARQFASAVVSVGREEPLPLGLQLQAGATLMGQVVYEGIAAPTPSSLTLLTLPVDFDQGPLVGTSSTGFALMSDNTFEYRGVFGRSLLIGQPQHADWYIKSITYRGQDLADSAFDFGSTETFGDIEVVVSAAGAAVTGRVTDERAAPVANYTVVLFPADRAKWTFRSRWLKTGIAAQDGTFRVRGVVPGDYWVVAVDRLEGSEVAGDLQNPDVLDALAARAVRISLGESQAQELTLRLVRR